MIYIIILSEDVLIGIAISVVCPSEKVLGLYHWPCLSWFPLSSFVPFASSFS